MCCVSQGPPLANPSTARETYNSEVLERPGTLDVAESLLQVLELVLNHALGVLCILDSLRLKGIDGLELARHIVALNLEALDGTLELVDNGLILENAAIVGEVDRLGLLGEDVYFSAGLVVALLEGQELRGCVAAQAEGAGDLGPIDLCGRRTLHERPSQFHQICQLRAAFREDN